MNITKTMKVNQLVNNSGRAINNQFTISFNGGIAFQSYDSIIAIKYDDDRVVLDKDYWNYSRTTSKYRSQFLNETTKETQQKIDEGIYELLELN